jgi:hypothetical protein
MSLGETFIHKRVEVQKHMMEPNYNCESEDTRIPKSLFTLARCYVIKLLGLLATKEGVMIKLHIVSVFITIKVRFLTQRLKDKNLCHLLGSQVLIFKL